MNIRTKCPKCKQENKKPYLYGTEVYPFRCVRCGVAYVVTVEPNGPHVETANVEKRKAYRAQIPEMLIGTPVYVSQRDNYLYLEQGKVVAKKHKHYKVKFVSCNKKINNRCLWIPDDCVDPVPPEMLGR